MCELFYQLMREKEFSEREKEATYGERDILSETDREMERLRETIYRESNRKRKTYGSLVMCYIMAPLSG